MARRWREVAENVANGFATGALAPYEEGLPSLFQFLRRGPATLRIPYYLYRQSGPGAKALGLAELARLAPLPP